MQISEEFLELIMHDFTLNKAQFKILGESYPPSANWDSIILSKNISEEDVNLLILLKGKLALKSQNQIIINYQNMIEFNNVKSNTKIQKYNISLDINESLKIFCDGACSNNPGKAGSGLALYYGNNEPILIYGEYEDYGTNNTAELNALNKALMIASESQSENIVIYSDSKYSIDCISKWAYAWKNKSWTKKGGEIKNLNLIKKAHELYDDIKEMITIEHVKGHSGIEGNELADRMALYAISSKSKEYLEYPYENIEDVLY